MKILLVGKMYAPDVGGMEKVVQQYAEFAAANGAQVEVLVFNSKPSLRDRIDVVRGIRVLRCASLGTLLSTPISWTFPFRLLTRMRNVDILHIHEPSPLAALVLALVSPRAKLIVTWHGDVIRFGVLRRLLDSLHRVVLGRAFAVTTTSPKLIEHSRTLKLFREKMHVLPLSIEAQTFIKPPVAPKLDLPGRYALFLGRLTNYKGLEVLCEALPYLSFAGYCVVIAGEGSQAELARKAMRDYPGKVHMIDRRVSEDEKHQLLWQCEAFLFPSTTPAEAFGIAQLEAMACGKPVINTALPTGVPWVCPDQICGVTTPPGDARSLAAAIDLLMASPETGRRLGVAARTRVMENFDDRIAEKGLMSLYHRALASEPTFQS